MHRIDTADHINNRFQDRDPRNNIPGTVCDDDWLNAVQEELVSIIEEAGITLQKGQHDQLVAALNRLRIQPVSNLSTLQGVTGAAGRSVYMLGRSSAGDGGGGQFFWNPSDLSSEVGNDEVTTGEGDGGFYVAPASDKTGASGAWVRQFAGAVFFEWYGAVGDGATDDTAAIAAALSAVSSHNLEYVEGAAGANYSVDQISFPDNLTATFSPCKFSANTSRSTDNPCITLGSNNAIDALEVRIPSGVEIDGVGGTSKHNLSIQRLDIESVDSIGRQGVELTTCNDGHFGYIRVVNFGSNGSGFSAQLNGCQRWLISSWYFKNYVTGWHTQEAGSVLTKNVTIGPGIADTGDPGTPSLTAGANGILCRNAQDITFVSPTVIKSREHGVRFGGDQDTENVTLLNPRLIDPEGTGYKFLKAAGVKTRRVSLVNPYVENAGSSGSGNKNEFTFHRVDDLSCVSPQSHTSLGVPAQSGINISAASRVSVSDPQIGRVAKNGISINGFRTDADISDIWVNGGRVEQTGDGTTGSSLMVDPDAQAVTNIRIDGLVCMDDRNSVVLRAPGSGGSVGNLYLKCESLNPEVDGLSGDSAYDGEVFLDRFITPSFISQNCRDGSSQYDRASDRMYRYHNGKWVGAQTYSVSNAATDRSFDANSTTVGELGNVVATLLKDLGYTDNV